MQVAAAQALATPPAPCHRAASAAAAMAEEITDLLPTASLAPVEAAEPKVLLVQAVTQTPRSAEGLAEMVALASSS